MINFKYIVGQEVKIKETGVTVKILSRFYGQWRDKETNTNSYKVSAKAVEPINLYEDQLEKFNE